MRAAKYLIIAGLVSGALVPRFCLPVKGVSRFVAECQPPASFILPTADVPVEILLVSSTKKKQKQIAVDQLAEALLRGPPPLTTNHSLSARPQRSIFMTRCQLLPPFLSAAVVRRLSKQETGGPARRSFRKWDYYTQQASASLDPGLAYQEKEAQPTT